MTAQGKLSYFHGNELVMVVSNLKSLTHDRAFAVCEEVDPKRYVEQAYSTFELLEPQSYWSPEDGHGWADRLIS